MDEVMVAETGDGDAGANLSRFTSLTQFEEVSLAGVYNLADGHAHQGFSQRQKRVIRDIQRIFVGALDSKQASVEDEFLQAFFTVAGQLAVSSGDLSLITYSASVAIQTVATFLREEGLSVALLHPTFDNLASLLRRSGVAVQPLEEAVLGELDFADRKEMDEVDALFLVLPNNPTGFTLNRTDFQRIIDYCVERDKLVIIDFSFRLFDAELEWDQHRLLLDSNVKFITIEDTGKVWPTLDLKAGILTTSSRLFGRIHDLQGDMLLNVSPFVLRLLTRIINSTMEGGVDAEIRSVVRENRRALRLALNDTCLSAPGANPLSVEWLKVQDGATALDIWRRLKSQGVFVLPGNQFFWNEPARGNQYLRVALMRPIPWFRTAVSEMRASLGGE